MLIVPAIRLPKVKQRTAKLVHYHEPGQKPYFCRMIVVGNALVSEDVLEKNFVCNLNACKGICCVDGDSGAPLTEEEADILEEEYLNFKPFLAEDGIASIEKEGCFTVDLDGDLVTPLVEGKHCAYVVFDETGTASCGIEKAWKAGKTGFRKPVSCHLYPIRIKNLPGDIDALNYDRWSICSAACTLGDQLKVPVYKFLREALIRKYGEGWYSELEESAEAWLMQSEKEKNS